MLLYLHLELELYNMHINGKSRMNTLKLIFLYLEQL